MEPIPKTVEALQELTRLGDESMARTLLRISREVERIVPEIVGLSVSVKGDLTFTVTASHGPVAQLDGVQYLAGGPCEATLQTGEAHTFRHGNATDEEQWGFFARATAAAGVGSTLSMPIMDGQTVVAGINLYASTPEAFDGHHDQLAEACGAWAQGAVTNADMAFATRFSAAQTPTRLRHENIVDQAIGVLMGQWGISSEDAQQRLQISAQRAGISDLQMARAVLGLHQLDGASDDVPGDLD